jgi:hypothetical protein
LVVFVRFVSLGLDSMAAYDSIDVVDNIRDGWRRSVDSFKGLMGQDNRPKTFWEKLNDETTLTYKQVGPCFFMRFLDWILLVGYVELNWIDL